MQANDTATRRTFIPGDEWLYLKLYCGFRTADDILRNAVYPFAQQLITDQLADRWFFIRYVDPHNHLRLRLHLTQLTHTGPVINRFNDCISDYVASDIIWKIQADTYQRELERYGTDTILHAEQLFYGDSRFVIPAIGLLSNHPDKEHLRWIIALASIDALLNDFDRTIVQKAELLDSLRNNFGNEFAFSNQQRKEIGNIFRAHRANMLGILEGSSETGRQVQELLRERKEITRDVVADILQRHAEGHIRVPLADFVASIIHMNMNRIFRSGQRKQEAVAYDLLYRHYHSLLMRNQQQT